ncbi:hypothetical protein, partial [Sphingomonas paucimobilis]|uniref:hypothetical protein n=1 Tax=Sphingomonas paucimobilis TaxID=13689 RepID=UPI0028D4BD0A
MIATDAATQAPLVCRLAPEQRLIRRLFDLPLPLPLPVREALVTVAGDTVSEIGGLFHASDVGGQAQGPSMRFVQGYRVGRLWLVLVEQGGIAHRYRVFGLRETGKDVMPLASPDGGRGHSLCALFTDDGRADVALNMSTIPPLQGEGDHAQHGGGVSPVGRAGFPLQPGHPSVRPAACHLPMQGRVWGGGGRGPP